MILIELIIVFVLISLLGYFLIKEEELKNEYKKKYEDVIESLPEKLRLARENALNRSRSVIKGKVSEHLAPYLPGFEHQPSDARFIGSHIDYLVFDGMSEGGEINVSIIDIKTGSSRLTALQRRIKKAVEEGRVSFETVRIDE